MDKFGSAFSQAKSYAEKGRSQITTQFDKIDKAVPIGHAQQRPRAGSSAAPSPSLAASGSVSSPATSRPPPPPIRNASSTAGVTPPVTRTRTPSTTFTPSNGGGVFTAMLHDSAEKEAFFTLLDEYFAARPEFKALFPSSSSPQHSAPLAPAASRPIPPPPVAPAPAPVSNGLGTATALYDFEGAQGEDLPFSTGDIITITEVVSDDWLRGELHGRSGIFPASYVQRSS
ncbi:hypothetical protein C6P46_001416 [Rhodotorula mucilaginosa]|uniref:SH3 domain-containing protein n=1 Tax=Rhodotorula mucilaginosa TaxID=5537 RepID=A0A9P6VV67_RHOMI|nr:hypothetical protein C6P46_001416 [Rhodotorula mucilaginosa]